MTDRENKIKVAVAMPVYNRRETTLQGLRSLFRVQQDAIDLRVFVTDDASPDGTAEAIRKEFANVVVIEGNGKLHYAGGINRAINEALKWSPDFVLATNDDAVFHRHSMKCLVQTATEHPDSLVGALLLLWDEPHRVFQVDPKWKTNKGGWVFPQKLSINQMRNNPFEVSALVGNCVLIPISAIRNCGLMDERRFPHGWGDAQYFERIRSAGWKLMVDPRSFVWCEPNTHPSPLHEESSNLFRTLFFDHRHPVNLKRQFVARLYSAPSKTKAAVSFIFYLFEMSKRAVRYRLFQQFTFI